MRFMGRGVYRYMHSCVAFLVQFTLDELLDLVQASEGELRDGLAKIDAWEVEGESVLRQTIARNANSILLLVCCALMFCFYCCLGIRKKWTLDMFLMA